MNAQHDFWNWFIQHEEELFEFDSNNTIQRETLFDRLAIELPKVHRDLTFEFGRRDQKESLSFLLLA